MLFKKASIYFALLYNAFLFLCVCSQPSVADTVNIQMNFAKPEILAITNREPNRTASHEMFESYMQWLFEKVPYIKVKKDHNQSLGMHHGVEQFQPNFLAMDEKRYSYLLYYTLDETSISYTISYIVFDSLYQDGIISNSHTFNKLDFDKAIENMANDIYLKITGEFGFFIGKMMYTERSKETGMQVLYSQDIQYDKKQYTKPNSLITSPTYCQGGTRVFFSEKQKYLMNIQEINLQNGAKYEVRLPYELQELNLSAPEISEDCKTLLVSASDGIQSSIYTYSLQEKRILSTIKDGNLNTRPSFGKDGSLYYISNRYGTPKIFTKSQDGTTNIISRGLGGYIYYAISPTFDKIAFVKIFNSKFYVGTMNIDGSSEILLKTGYIIEAPSWVPAGNNIIVSVQETRKPVRKVYSISTLTGYSYPIWKFNGEIVQVNWVVNPNDTLQEKYH